MTQVNSVLLVEDQDDLRDALSDQLLITQEFLVEQAANGQEALHHIAQKNFDLIILDVGLPDTDGRELCKVMRKQNVKCPIVMLTGHDGDADNAESKFNPKQSRRRRKGRKEGKKERGEFCSGRSEGEQTLKARRHKQSETHTHTHTRK